MKLHARQGSLASGRFFDGKKPGNAFSEHEAALEPASGVRRKDEMEPAFGQGDVPGPVMVADYRVRFLRPRRLISGFIADIERADGTKVAGSVRLGKYVETTVKDPESGDVLNFKLVAASPAIRLTIYLNEDRLTRETVREALQDMMRADPAAKVRASYLLGRAVRDAVGRRMAPEIVQEHSGLGVELAASGTYPTGRRAAGNMLLALTFAGGLADPDPRVRTNCAWGLSAMALGGIPLGAAVPMLEQGVNDPAGEVRSNCTLALMAHYSNTFDEGGMERLLNHSRRDVRRAAARALPERMY